MSALLLKDYYVIFRQMKIFLLLILVFSCIPGTFYSTFAVVYASMLPYTALAYDERSKWDQLAAMMPYSARDVVLSKYLFGWISVAIAAAATFVLQTILSFVWLSDVTGPSIPVILLSVCVAVCILDITLPMMFRFGVEKGRLAMFLIIFLVCASAGGIATIEQSSLDGGFYLSFSLVPAVIAAAVLTAVSIPLALWAARSQSRLGDAVGTVLDQLCMAVPPFFTGILLSWLFSITLHWFVHGQFPDLGTDPAGALQYLFFAAVAIAVPRIAMTVRMLRSTIQGEMRKDYVRTAISRGNDRAGVLRRHVLRNALVPVVTFLAQTMAEIVAAGIVVEQVFAVPGLGRMLVASISNRDYPVVQAIVVILAFWVVLAGTAADIVNQRIDPRLRLGGAS